MSEFECKDQLGYDLEIGDTVAFATLGHSKKANLRTGWIISVEPVHIPGGIDVAKINVRYLVRGCTRGLKKYAHNVVRVVN